MRDQLIPVVNGFNPLIIKGLISMADYYKPIHMIYDTKVIDDFVSMIKENTVIISMEIDYGMSFWKPVIIKWLNRSTGDKKIIPSKHSIEKFVERLNKRSFGIISLNKTVSFRFEKNEESIRLILIV